MGTTLPKQLLFLAAALIVVVTMVSTHRLTSIMKEEERQKVLVWAESVAQRAELVAYTEKLFDELAAEEKVKADRLAEAYRILQQPNPGTDLTFVTNFLFNNTTIPVFIENESGPNYDKNIPDPPPGVSREAHLESWRSTMMERYPPIHFEDVGQKVYYSESVRLTELRTAMNDLIESFISEILLNSASVPVLLVDSMGTRIVKSQGVDVTQLQDSAALKAKLMDMAGDHLPLPIQWPGQGLHLVFYEESALLTQLRLFPAVQLILIGAFLLVAYLVFSASRRAEQNRVWVGMAKETAHQLGTPLSSLMAWSNLLASRGVDPEALHEMDKDISRLQVVAERFSKIGSQAKLDPKDPIGVVQETVDYMRPRVSKHVALDAQLGSSQGQALMSEALLSWVLENLMRNAVDAMDGEGVLTVRADWQEDKFVIEVEDNGKGMSKAVQRKVFQPGFTTKSRGWGLGLSLAQRIVSEVHQGQLTVAWSEPGKGTCFRIALSA